MASKKRQRNGSVTKQKSGPVKAMTEARLSKLLKIQDILSLIQKVDMKDMKKKDQRSNGGPAMVDNSDMSKSRASGSAKCASCLMSNLFLMFLLLGIFVGVALGVFIRHHHPWFSKDKRRIMYLGFLGSLFLSMLKMTIIPLVVSSLIAGIASIPSKAAGRLGGYTILYFMTTTVMAAILGILLVATIKPGEWTSEVTGSRDRALYPADSGLDLIRNLVPPNLIAATIQRPGLRMSTEIYDYDNPMVSTESGSNILGLVAFSCVFGIIVGRLGKRGLPVYHFCVSLQDAIIQLVQLFIWFAPVGICFLLAARIVEMNDPLETFKLLAYYALTVLVGLAIHGFIVLPIIFVIFTKKNPYKLLLDVSSTLITAFGTASSSAAIPVTMNDLEYRAKLDTRVIKFVIPVGATINMNGTALYEAVAAIFIAQVTNLDMDATKYVIVSITATLAAIGAAGVPEAGLMALMIVLTAIGLPTDLVGVIITIEWFIDRCRAVINVWGNSIGTGIVHHLCKKYLVEMDEREKLPQLFGEDNLGYDAYRPNTVKEPVTYL